MNRSVTGGRLRVTISRIIGSLLTVAAAVVIATQSLASAEEPAPHKAAIFVANHSDNKALDRKLSTFGGFISSRITEKGFSVISQEVATDALHSLLKDSKQTEADQLLSNNSSALRLAQTLGADHIVVASISSYGTENRMVDAYSVKTATTIYTLRVTYKVLEGVQGETLAGDTFKVSREIRSTENSKTESTNLINELLDEASVKIADSVSTKEINTVSAAPKLVQFSIACGMQDLAQLPVSIPDVRLTADNTLVIEKGKVEVQSLDVTVELDGTVIGSAPGTFKAAPGPHKLRLTREGFKDWERPINVVGGEQLKVVLQMTEAGYQRWKDNTTYLDTLLNSLEVGKTLEDADVKVLEGEAQMLRQSGYKVDIKYDEKGRSIF